MVMKPRSTYYPGHTVVYIRISPVLRVLFCMILASDNQLVEEPNIPCTMTIGLDLDAPSSTLQFIATLRCRDQSWGREYPVENCLLNIFWMLDADILRNVMWTCFCRLLLCTSVFTLRSGKI